MVTIIVNLAYARFSRILDLSIFEFTHFAVIRAAVFFLPGPMGGALKGREYCKKT
jgi:hypothetical protein